MYEKVHELVWIKLNESKCTVKQWKVSTEGYIFYNKLWKTSVAFLPDEYKIEAHGEV